MRTDFRGVTLQLPSRFAHQTPQRRELRLGPRTTIVAVVARWRALTRWQHVRGDISHRRGARGTLPITERLDARGPEDDLRGEEVILTKRRDLLAEDALDSLGVQDTGEGRPVALEEWLRDGIESVSVTPTRCGYAVHEKARWKSRPASWNSLRRNRRQCRSWLSLFVMISGRLMVIADTLLTGRMESTRGTSGENVEEFVGRWCSEQWPLREDIGLARIWVRYAIGDSRSPSHLYNRR